ncbi:MAG: RHS repeat-associated core domain-containing protein, partial [Lachnospiraceae bacterium]|nr:RHS repeat-associated core domain-containing protein [Lachnospiraceae bacterium]
YYGKGLLAQENSNGYLTYHFNNVGSTMAVTAVDGEVTAKYNYSPYGELLEGEYNANIPFLYNGQFGVMTDGNGLYYMRARYYNVDIKRFINQDVLIGTLERISSLNRFSYVEGNPISFLDPFGLDKWIYDMLHGWVSQASFYVNIVLSMFGLSNTPLAYYINAFLIGFDFGVYINEFINSGFDWMILIEGFINTLVNATFYAFGILADSGTLPESTGLASEVASTIKDFFETIFYYEM